ncbi:type IV pilus twitching motility protein PilT [Candidatus Margulisiibacteriota bacterium]
MHIDDLLKMVVNSNASDLHLVAGQFPTMRVNGAMMTFGDEILSDKSAKALIYEILSQAQSEELEKTRELDFAYKIGTEQERFRVNVHFQKDTLAATLRVIPGTIPAAEKLNLPSIVYDIAKLENGLVLVTGPTGSGKSTTLAVILDLINKTQAKHVITIEDPIEFVHPHQQSLFEQREVGRDTFSFAEALKRALRQDPDVILVGEMRDAETISTAITAAETGHLVFSTLHTNDTVQTIDRIIDVFPSHQQSQIRMQLSMSLEAVLAQQLLPLKDNSGRVAAIEVLLATDSVRNVIRKANTHELHSIMEIESRVGMQTMNQALQTLKDKGIQYISETEMKKW